MKKKPLPATDLADDLASDVRSVVSRLKRNLRAQSSIHGDLTATQIAVLMRLKRGGPASTSELARAEGIRAQSMGTAIAPLEDAGLVMGTPDPADGRRTILSLTDACHALITEVQSARQDWLSRTIRARLSSAEQQQLAAAMELLKRLVEE
ncbi:MarR family transcriptional regulator [Caballeronia sp. LZ028]|uniref:MarR family winged helix-turn-helix transcriptional regulator n=1 Tax=Caballeronia sp. LZ028 TaxID=3038563 RepID=UPI00285EA754|nr:MarR family transcriptional regulator [Caballeronia sp. LZ028]MDR5770053.1 MarR family transcriptional regulator [Caballeronia sp. LZ028]